VAAVLLASCGSGPSKGQALLAIQSGVKEDASCTLPLDVLAQLKVQHTSKGLCVPREGAPKARACVDALVAGGVTRQKPESYLLAWPDEVASASLSDVPAYERRARNLTYGACVELVGELRAGRFPCAEVKVQKILKITASDPKHAEVTYERDVTAQPFLAAVEAACGAVSRPPSVAQAAFTKGADAWELATTEGDRGAN
jgi:hypothetical protein